MNDYSPYVGAPKNQEPYHIYAIREALENRTWWQRVWAWLRRLVSA